MVRRCLKEGRDAVVEDDAVAVAMAWARWRLGVMVVDGGSSSMAAEVEGDWEMLGERKIFNVIGPFLIHHI